MRYEWWSILDFSVHREELNWALPRYEVRGESSRTPRKMSYEDFSHARRFLPALVCRFLLCFIVAPFVITSPPARVPAFGRAVLRLLAPLVITSPPAMVFPPY
jgi:hypothetical protein